MVKSANQFRNLRELEKYIKNNIPNTLLRDGNIERILKGTMQQSVYDVVYGSYVPQQYKRRRNNGGLADIRAMRITEAILDGNNFKLTFENLTRGNDTIKDRYLVDLIEIGADSYKSKFGIDAWESEGVWSEERPFVEETINRINANPKFLIDAIKKAFVKIGFRVV